MGALSRSGYADRSVSEGAHPTRMKPTLGQIRECVRTDRYVVTVHAAEEMDDDSLPIFDV
jgi:hypothetical protein